MSGFGVVCNCCHSIGVLVTGWCRTNVFGRGAMDAAFGPEGTAWNHSEDVYDYDMIIITFLEAPNNDTASEIDEVVTQTSIPSDWSGRILVIAENDLVQGGDLVAALNSYAGSPFVFDNTYDGLGGVDAVRQTTDIPDMPANLGSAGASDVTGGTLLYDTSTNPALARYYSDGTKLWIGIGDASTPILGTGAPDPTDAALWGIEFLQACRAAPISP